MPNEFVQKKRFGYRKFVLLTDKIQVEEKTIRKHTKYEIDLDQLGFSIVYQADNTIIGKIFLLVCLVIPFVLTIVALTTNSIDTRTLTVNYILWVSLAVLNLLSEPQDDVILTGGQHNVLFYRNVPNENDVLSFVNDLIDTSKEYIKEKYAQVDMYMSEDDFRNRLRWLIDHKVITETESDQLIKDYKLKRLL